ncbi:MAG: leucyl aminopeptidase family protein [Gammaproteobacteria bacterium]|nr:leucyl aminopeptidase family protein [Gammaproteobacteria bacterium]MBU1624379.1 leucyl aminopeptidase family protein [Gammaproteobacteria bacterium]MBU1981107.1 leucyl aminopeptidase family protein [Gammaproteobacteria bacterium]
MLAQLTLSKTLPTTTHLLVLLPKSKTLAKDVVHGALLAAVLKRRNMKVEELAKSPVAANVADGTLVAWAMLDDAKDAFAQQVLVRKALQLVLDEQPKALSIAVSGATAQRAAELAVYGAWVNSALLPMRKKKDERKPLQKITLVGDVDKKPFDALRALAAGNLLSRELTVMAPNDLTPGLYRQRIKKLAQANGWKIEEFTMPKLRKLGAGAFVAVAQGSEVEDAAIVHLSYKHPKAKQTVALVGKGICFDTGGHNLKPSRYMHNMHEDMNGSAVSLGILLAASEQRLPVNIDCWLAIAQNHISPKAYKQNDIVKALNGTHIEIIHTDAEGRMVLADTLTLASRAKPDLMIDFATLTGSMATALGARYSGVFASSDELAQRAVNTGKQSGERLCAFPQDEDYETELDSKVADIKQCTLTGDADHILATRFLKRFVEHDTPWLHVDLSSSRCEGGLGIVASEVNGFGVAWGVAMLKGAY